jgi:hypothetical protein
MDQRSLPETFRSPPAEYGPAPLLVFNDEHEGVAGAARILRRCASRANRHQDSDLHPAGVRFTRQRTGDVRTSETSVKANS